MGRSKIIRVRGFVTLVVLALVLAACGGGAEQTTTTEAGPGTTAATQPTGGEGEPAEPGGGEPERPVIVVSLSTDVDILEPHTFRTTGAYAVTRALYQPPADQVFVEEGGVRVGTSEVVPSPILESYTVSDDGLEATFVMNPEATFDNGDPITAGDLAYTFRRTIEGPGYIGLLLPFIGIESSDQIEVVDDRTLIIRPNVASSLFDRFMTFQVFGPINQAVAEANATPDDPWAFEYFTNNAVSSGPYSLVEFDRDRGQIVLDPNPGYPGEVANGGIIVRNIPDAEQRALLLQRGEIDVAVGLPPRLLAELQNDPNVNVYTAPSTRSVFLGMNVDIAPLDNKLVRQAISYAIPYDALLNQVMFGFASPAGTLIPSTMETYAGDAIDVYETNLDEARRLLEESGVGEFSIELAVPQSSNEQQQAAVLIQDNLRQIGIDAQINVLPDADYQGRRNNRELPLFFHEWYSWGDDPFYQMTFLLKCGQFTNFANYCNEELDQIIAEGTFTTDPAKRQELSTADHAGGRSPRLALGRRLDGGDRQGHLRCHQGLHRGAEIRDAQEGWLRLRPIAGCGRARSGHTPSSRGETCGGI